jgi:hypothetical protein
MEIKLELLGQVLGMSADSLANELKNADGEFKSESDIKSFLETKVSDKLKAAEKKGRDEGIGRAKKETLTQLEKELATDYGIEEMLPAKDLIKKIIEKNSTVDATDPNTIKTSDVFRDAIKAEKEAQKKILDEYDSFKKEVAFKEKRTVVETRLPELLEKGKFVLPDNPKLKETHLTAFKNALFSGVDFDVSGESPKVLGSDGKPLLDNLHNEIGFEQFVTQNASNFFPIAAGDNRQGAGNRAGAAGGGAGKVFNFGHITSQEAGMEKLYTIQDKDERAALSEHIKTLPA